MADTTSVVKLHYPHDSRFSLALITDDETERIRKARTLSENPDIEVAIRENTTRLGSLQE